MEKQHTYLLLIIIGLFISLVATYIFYPTQHYFLFSVVIIGSMLLFFFYRFEMKKVQAREIVLLAMLAALAAISRVPFAGLPSVQPTSFVIISTGLFFGAESGFLIGAVAALVSNIFLGQGPWTPWQMFSWGLMGFSAGLIRRQRLMQRLPAQCAFGFFWGILYGWLMNLWIIVSNTQNLSLGFVVGVYANSISHDIAHAISNVVFIAIFSNKWGKILHRFKKKYGLLEK